MHDLDTRLAIARRALARCLTNWRVRNQITYRQIDALSKAAVGRSGIPPATIARWARAAEDPSVVWEPQAITIATLGAINDLVVRIQEGAAEPPPSLKQHPGIEPMRRLDGQPLSAGDIALVLIGTEGILY